MAKYEYEGAIENISESQLKFVGDNLARKGYKNTEVFFEKVGSAGDNYNSNVIRIINNDAKGKPFKMFAKFASPNPQLRMIAGTQNLFENEIIMYTELLPKYRELQLAAKVPDDDLLRFAECYGAQKEAPNEVILLEDLNESNFVMLNRLDALSNECIRSVLKSFAALHSSAYVLKDQEPEKFEEYRKRLSNYWERMLGVPEIVGMFSHMTGHALSLLGDNERRQNVLKNVTVQDVTATLSKLIQEDAGSKYSVIQQGDCWTNNIMFKFENDKLLESVMVDYQVSKESNPVCDLFYLLFNCTDYALRQKHFHEWINYYHDELGKLLKYHGLEIEAVYPREQLDKDLKRYGKLMFFFCFMFIGTLTAKTEDAAKMMEALEKGAFDMEEIKNMLATNTNTLIKTKLEGLIDSFLEFVFL